VDPTSVKSNSDSEEPSIPALKTDIEDPMRVKLRMDMAEPTCM